MTKAILICYDLPNNLWKKLNGFAMKTAEGGGEMEPLCTAEALVQILKQLHRWPETAYEEYQTAQLIRSVLREADIPLIDTGMDTCTVALIRGGRPGKTIALRADIDALPMQEETDLPWKSQREGVMHACGHDFHTAMMLGAALLLKERQADLPGCVKIIFQPAEELDNGADQVIASGVVDDCELFLAGHSYPQFKAGTIGVKEGAVMAAVDRFAVTIRGTGCHAGQPNKGVDPIVTAAAVIQSLQSIISRRMNPFTPRVLSITRMTAGTTWNIIPDTAFFEGTLRTLDEQQRALAEEEFRRIVQGVAASYGAEAEIDWIHGSPAVLNDEKLCIIGRETAAQCGLIAARQEDTMGGEDFSCYLRGKPGLFVRIGTGGDYPGHHPKFTVDPEALYPAAEYFARLAENCLRAEWISIDQREETK